MIDNDPLSNMSPAEIAEMTERLEFTGEPVESFRTGPDTTPIEFPTSIKLTHELNEACKRRAKSLGMRKSTYIRSLIERDIAEADMGEQAPEWVREIRAVLAKHANDEHRQAS